MKDELHSNFRRNGCTVPGENFDGIEYTMENSRQFLVNMLDPLKLPEGYGAWSPEEQHDWAMKNLEERAKGMPISLMRLTAAMMRSPNFDGMPFKKPEWLDEEKFHRGQKFILDNLFATVASGLIGILLVFTFDDGLKPLIVTRGSVTPFSAFRRFLSNVLIQHIWYQSDPWVEGTMAYKKTAYVNKLHKKIRALMGRMTQKEIDEAATIPNAMCPTRNMLLEDFQSCPVGNLLYRPHTITKDSPSKQNSMNQCSLSVVQFALSGLPLLYPKHFGIHNATDKDLDDYCHFWKGIGYFLGIDDVYNVWNGTLEENKRVGKDLVDHWVKPNFRDITPEWEHMSRCMVEGSGLYVPGLTYEAVILYMADILDIPMPKFHAVSSYYSRFVHQVFRIYFSVITRIPGVVSIINKLFAYLLRKAANYTSEQNAKLQERSRKIMESVQRTA